MSLPKEYDGVKTTLENQPLGIAGLNLQLVRARLMDAEALLEDSRRDNPPRQARCLGDTAAFSATPRKNPTCNICRRKGHIARFCRSNRGACYSCGQRGHLARDCGRTRTREHEAASTAVTFVAGQIAHKDWIVDSGATHHMCSEKTWFTNLRPHVGTISCASKMKS
ncbi:hypothetical protein JTE90_015395 [Oedothorax gibbosus]|uniref:CCHC-type domain-containing protein n=1 Tax=Oedothorax gibbosus TaxID=931172 RepID=A0AAV6TTE8_9ARAC|nr:hypothetical protein JTE90_015395 [Oedothorax gibbosus]